MAPSSELSNFVERKEISVGSAGFLDRSRKDSRSFQKRGEKHSQMQKNGLEFPNSN